jgi:hypothetical protein
MRISKVPQWEFPNPEDFLLATLLLRPTFPAHDEDITNGAIFNLSPSD